MTSRSLNTYCDVTQCMNGLWMFITKHESPKGDPQTWSSPPRNNGACVIILSLSPGPFVAKSMCSNQFHWCLNKWIVLRRKSQIKSECHIHWSYNLNNESHYMSVCMYMYMVGFRVDEASTAQGIYMGECVPLLGVGSIVCWWASMMWFMYE